MFKRLVPIVLECQCVLGPQCATSLSGESDTPFSAEYAVDSVVVLH